MGLLPREGLVAHSKGGGAGTTRTVGTPAGCHCPLHSLDYTALHPTTPILSTLHHLMVGCHSATHTTPHWWPTAGPLPSLHLQSVQRTGAPVSHIFPSVELHCGNCSKAHQICASMKRELCGVWASQQFVEKCALQSSLSVVIQMYC